MSKIKKVISKRYSFLYLCKVRLKTNVESITILKLTVINLKSKKHPQKMRVLFFTKDEQRITKRMSSPNHNASRQIYINFYIFSESNEKYLFDLLSVVKGSRLRAFHRLYGFDSMFNHSSLVAFSFVPRISRE